MEIEGARHSRILAFENSSEFEAGYQPIVVLTIDLRWPEDVAPPEDLFGFASPPPQPLSLAYFASRICKPVK